MNPRTSSILLLAPLIVIVACTAAENYYTVDDLRPEMLAPQPYLIQPGDELDIRFFHTPLLNTVLPVRPDGIISMPYAQAVKAAGRTPEDVSRDLAASYGKVLNDPEVAVIVRSFSDYKVHVGGRVVRPGVFPLSGPLTVTQAIFQAGGFQQEAWLSQTLIIRKKPDGQPMVICVDLWDALEGRDLRQDLQLRPWDVVYVPDSAIALVNKFVDLYIRKNIPANFGFRFDVPI